MKAVISVTGKDNVGIIAGVSTLCSRYGANIIDITQSVLSEYFAIMLVEVDKLTIPFAEFTDIMANYGKEKHLEIHTMHEDIFSAMHEI